MSQPPDHTTRRTVLAALGAMMLPACRRGWSPPELDPTSRSQIKPYVPGAEAYATHEERWIATACAQCPAACSVRVRVVEGRAVRIESHADGAIGVRGLSGLQALYDPDRIPGPLRRHGDRLVPVSWSDALDTLARALADVRARAPERLLVMSGLERGGSHDLLARFCEAFGTPNFVDGTPRHGATLARAMELSLGVRTLPTYSWEGAGTILSLGTALFEDACRSTYYARVASAIRRDRRQRAQLIHAGPVFDLAAYNADRWLRIRPGTAGAIALGVSHVLLREAMYARELIEAARGFDAFRTLAAAYPPARVAALTGCDAVAIEELAYELWERRPALVVVDDRGLDYTNGLATARAAIALSALLGSIEHPRGGLRLPAAAPIEAWPAIELDEVARRGLATPRLDGAGRAPYLGARAVLDTLPDAIAQTPPAAALLYHANPLYARAQPTRWRAALEAVPLVVSFSPFLDETVAEVADLVLPDHTYLERHDDATPLPATPRASVGVRRPAVTPLHDTRATADVLLDLARRLGEPIASALPWREAREAYEARWLGLHTAARGTIVAATPRAFLDRLYEDGRWADQADAPPRRVELAMPDAWSEPTWHGDPARYPLALIPYHPLGHADGSGANQPWLRHLTSRPGTRAWTLAASIAVPDAPPGIRDGDRIRVTSPFGSIVLPVHLDPRIARGCVAIPTGGGHRAYGRWARGFGVNVMELVAAEAAEDTGATLLATTRVRVEAAS